MILILRFLFKKITEKYLKEINAEFSRVKAEFLPWKKKT